jgi:hypothetical protein
MSFLFETFRGNFTPVAIDHPEGWGGFPGGETSMMPMKRLDFPSENHTYRS